MSNTFGTILRLTTFGESHGPCVGGVVDGCPARLELSEADIQPQLDRRRPGQSNLTTARAEADKVRLLSGVGGGLTLGTPIAFEVANRDVRPGDYSAAANIPRPGHADYTYRKKYCITAGSGGGRASARETVSRVAGGAIAEKLLRVRFGVEIVAWTSAVGEVEAPDRTATPPSRAEVDASPVRCPDRTAAERMTALIEKAAAEGDSVGGIVTCVCRNVPVGWGEPVFQKVEAALAAAMLSIPAAKGFEVGSGFGGTRLRGSQNNDRFVRRGRGLGTLTNHAGGILGGITNGEPVVFRVAFKPVASIRKAQDTADYDGSPVVLELGGRHDPCVVSRAVPIVESMAALVLADMALLAAAVSSDRTAL